jgi:hypothetical protein
MAVVVCAECQTESYRRESKGILVGSFFEKKVDITFFRIWLECGGGFRLVHGIQSAPQGVQGFVGCG